MMTWVYLVSTLFFKCVIAEKKELCIEMCITQFG